MGVLTNKSIEALEKRLKAGESVKEWTPDGDGLYLRCQKAGAMSFVLRRWGFPSLTIGKASIGLAKARQMAREAINQQASGIDPSAQKRAAKEALKVKPVAEVTVGEIIDRWIERYAKPELRTWPAIWRSLNNDVVPKWGKRPIKDITRPMVADLIDGIVDRGAPRQAALVFAYLHKIFSWALSRGYIDSNPATGLQKPKQAPSRDRVLSDQELRLLIEASRTLGYPFQPIIELLAYSGQRKSEIGDGLWSEVDLGAKIWKLPAARTKNKTAHHFPISEPMFKILESIPRHEKCDYLFTTTGKTPVSGYSRIKRAIDAKIAEMNGGEPIAAWSLHDLRRTAATGMASINVQPHVIEAVLNHRSGAKSGVAGVYNRHQYESEMRAALDAWARRLQEIVTGEAAENVVSFQKR